MLIASAGCSRHDSSKRNRKLLREKEPGSGRDKKLPLKKSHAFNVGAPTHSAKTIGKCGVATEEPGWLAWMPNQLEVWAVLSDKLPMPMIKTTKNKQT